MDPRRVRACHLQLGTRFAMQVRLTFTEATFPLIRAFHARLVRSGIRPEARMAGRDLMLEFELSIEDALALDFHQVPGPLESALTHAFPALASDPDALHARLQILARQCSWLRRRAG